MPLAAVPISDADDVRRLVADFHASHREIFEISRAGFGDRARDLARAGALPAARGGSAAPAACSGRRAARDGETGLLSPTGMGRCHGARGSRSWPTARSWSGPAIIESSFTTVVVDPGAVATADRRRQPVDHGLRSA